MASTALAGRTFSERLVDFLDIADCRLVTDDDEREAVFRLRYDAYVREGAIPLGFSKRFSDPLDDTPNAWILGIYVGDRLASSLRIHVASPETPEAPATAVFSDILMPEIERGHTIVDPTRFVADHALARLHPELPYATVRLAFLASEYFDADLALATVRVEHQAFYKRLFGFKPICEPRQYPSLAKPISLMAIHCPTHREGVMERNPFLLSTPQERAALFNRVPTAQNFPATIRLPPGDPAFETARAG